jgi:hypothetical protein
MLKSILIVFLLLVSQWGYSQTLTLAQLKEMKNNYQPELIQVDDADIAYPVTGVVYIDTKYSLMGESVVEVEVWIVDSKGTLVYNNVFAAKNLSEKNFDKEYMRYMMLQGKRLLNDKEHASLSNTENDS